MGGGAKGRNGGEGRELSEAHVEDAERGEGKTATARLEESGEEPEMVDGAWEKGGAGRGVGEGGKLRA